MVLSSFVTSMVWPAWTPCTRGTYMQSCCFTDAGVVGAANLPFTVPGAMRTSTSFSVLLLLTMTSLAFIGLAAQIGSDFRGSSAASGALPEKATLPLTVPNPAGSGVFSTAAAGVVAFSAAAGAADSDSAASFLEQLAAARASRATDMETRQRRPRIESLLNCGTD